VSFAAKKADPRGKKSWRVLRGGVADLYRRAEISQRAAERYLDALAGVDEQTTLGFDRTAGQRDTGKARSTGVTSAGEDRALLAAVSRGEFT